MLDQHKKEIEEMIVKEGGPYSTIDAILSKSGPLKKENKNTTPFLIECLNYIVTQRCVSESALNDVVAHYNLGFKDNKFYLLK